MQNVATGRPARGPHGGKLAAIVASGLLALLSLGFLAGGGLLLWADSKKDDQGYISTGTERFSTDTSALVTENLDLDLDGAESLVDDGVYGKVRVTAESDEGKPVFVGIARTSDVSDYLRGSSHDVITDVEFSPFHAGYDTRAGRTPAAPGERKIWAATAQGDGEQALTWDVRDGDWSVVVMSRRLGRRRSRHQRGSRPRLPGRGGEDLAHDRLRAAHPGRRAAVRRGAPAPRRATG